MDDSRDPRRERRRVAFAFALAVLPPLSLLAYLSVLEARHDRNALRAEEETHARGVAARVRETVVQAVRAAETACFPEELSKLRSRDPVVFGELVRALERVRRAQPIAARFVAFDEDGKLLFPDPTLPYRADGTPPPAEDEDGATTQDALARRRQAAAVYERARELENGHDLPGAEGLLLRLADDPDASAALRVRAAHRLARDLEASGDLEPAIAAYARAANASAQAREDGEPLVPLAALREAELLRARGDASGAYGVARDLGRALLAGGHSELSAEEWDRSLARARTLVDAVASTWSGSAASGDPWDSPVQGAKLIEHDERELRDRIAWSRELAGELGDPLRSSLANESSDELLHLSTLRERVVIAYRVLPALPLDPAVASVAGIRTKRLLFGVELDLERLARDVISPLLGDESLQKDASIAVLDGHGIVRAYAGRDAAPDASGRPSETDAIEATLPLEPPPLWQIRALRPADALNQKARQRVILFASLVVLALVATFAGGTATLRSVARSLELARMKQDFVSNVTHELKTPLTSIKMYAETLALGRARDEEKKKEYLAHIIRESDRLHRLIDDILDFARLGEGKRPFVLAEGDVCDCVEEALHLFRHSAEVRGFELYVDLPKISSLPPVDLDRDAIVRSVLNLLSNAVKYSGDSRYVRVAVKREGDMIAASVEDRGLGIDPDDIDRIFERFYRAGESLTREVSGAGLGLALVDEVVRSHGGQIRVESTKGKGSTFTILLPIVPDYRNVSWPPPESTEGADASSGEGGK
jgi:signal transduction histidine kinase